MRVFTAVLLWLITTVLLAAAVPAVWAQRTIVDRQGYQALAQRAATNGELQAATAAELVTQIERLGYDVDPAGVSRISRAYTASSKFPGQFGQANGYAHRWLFTDTIGSEVDTRGRWVIDLAPMLDDESFAQTLQAYNVTVPDSVPIPLTDNAPRLLRPGALRDIGQWGPWVSLGSAGLAAVSALLMLAVAPRRGKALVALGLSARSSAQPVGPQSNTGNAICGPHWTTPRGTSSGSPKSWRPRPRTACTSGSTSRLLPGWHWWCSEPLRRGCRA